MRELIRRAAMLPVVVVAAIGWGSNAGAVPESIAASFTGSDTALASQQAERVAVGVTKFGGAGNRVVSAGQTAVVELKFRLLEAGTTTLKLAGPPGGVPEVLDSTGAVIGSLRFDAAPVTLSGS